MPHAPADTPIRPAEPRRTRCRPRPRRPRARWGRGAAAAGIVLLLAACQVAAPPQVSDLRTIEGPLQGYPDAVARAFVASDGDVAYGEGFVLPGADPRVEGTLVALEDLDADALRLPEGPACPELVLDPPDLRIHWQRDLFVFDADVVIGYLVRSSNVLGFPQAAGDRVFGYVAASTAGSVTGTCDLGSEVVAWDLQLLEGWNHLEYAVAADVPVRSSTVRVAAPGDTIPWRFFLPN